MRAFVAWLTTLFASTETKIKAQLDVARDRLAAAEAKAKELEEKLLDHVSKAK